MERSLEALDKMMEQNWLDLVEYDKQGKLILSRKFMVFKKKVTTLREVVERHFNTVMKEIMNGLPSIGADDDQDDEDHTFGSALGGKWTCRVCQVKNNADQHSCGTCRTARPDLSVHIGGKP